MGALPSLDSGGARALAWTGDHRGHRAAHRRARLSVLARERLGGDNRNCRVSALQGANGAPRGWKYGRANLNVPIYRRVRASDVLHEDYGRRPQRLETHLRKPGLSARLHHNGKGFDMSGG